MGVRAFVVGALGAVAVVWACAGSDEVPLSSDSTVAFGRTSGGAGGTGPGGGAGGAGGFAGGFGGGLGGTGGGTTMDQCMVDGGICLNGGLCCGFVCCTPSQMCCDDGNGPRCFLPSVNQPMCPPSF